MIKLKKEKNVTGSVISLEVGQNAIYHDYETDKPVWTSPVVHSIQNPDGTVWFETQNSVYRITPVETYGNSTFAELFKEMHEELDRLEKEWRYNRYSRAERVNQYNEMTTALLNMRSIKTRRDQ